jgi:hypothetical protein
MFPSSAALPISVTLTSLASLLGPLTILAVMAVIATLVVTVIGVVGEHQDASAFERILGEAVPRPGASGLATPSRSAA